MKSLNLILDNNKEDAMFVRKKLIEYNSSCVTETSQNTISEEVNIFLKGDDEIILGGITGYIYWNCLHIEIFWIDDRLRGQGQGKNLLNIAEKLALKKGCKLIKLDTFSFQAPEFYKKQGFKILGTLENYPEGFKHYYLYKDINAS